MSSVEHLEVVKVGASLEVEVLPLQVVGTPFQGRVLQAYHEVNIFENGSPLFPRKGVTPSPANIFEVPEVPHPEEAELASEVLAEEAAPLSKPGSGGLNVLYIAWALAVLLSMLGLCLAQLKQAPFVEEPTQAEAVVSPLVHYAVQAVEWGLWIILDVLFDDE